MSLVQGDERYTPRVGPKVFADVPTQAEVQGAKRGRAAMLLIALFLAGLLVAAVLVIGWFLQQKYPDQTEPGGAKKQIEALTTQHDTDTTRIHDLENQVAPFSTVSTAEGNAAVVIGRIQELMVQRPDARDRLATLYKDQWAAYDRLVNRSWMPGSLTQIQADSGKIGTLVDAINRLPPPTTVVVAGGGSNIAPPCDPRVHLCPPPRR
ncbi:MAG: hypothetical protein QM759_05390 [Terricaulis sp.]